MATRITSKRRIAQARAAGREVRNINRQGIRSLLRDAAAGRRIRGTELDVLRRRGLVRGNRVVRGRVQKYLAAGGGSD